MLVKIKKLDSSTEDITVEEKDLVSTLKEKLAEQAGLHKDQVRLILKGQPLLDDKSMADCKVKAGDMIHMVITMRGGSL